MDKATSVIVVGGFQEGSCLGTVDGREANSQVTLPRPLHMSVVLFSSPAGVYSVYTAIVS